MEHRAATRRAGSCGRSRTCAGNSEGLQRRSKAAASAIIAAPLTASVLGACPRASASAPARGPTRACSRAGTHPELKTAESRLRYYAERYDTVEVNSSYYAIPDGRPRSAGRSARRRLRLPRQGLRADDGPCRAARAAAAGPAAPRSSGHVAGARRAGRRPAAPRVRAVPPRAPAAARRRQARRHPHAVPAELRAVRGRVGGDPRRTGAAAGRRDARRVPAARLAGRRRSARRRSTRSPTGV